MQYNAESQRRRKIDEHGHIPVSGCDVKTGYHCRTHLCAHNLRKILPQEAAVAPSCMSAPTETLPAACLSPHYGTLTQAGIRVPRSAEQGFRAASDSAFHVVGAKALAGTSSVRCPPTRSPRCAPQQHRSLGSCALSCPRRTKTAQGPTRVPARHLSSSNSNSCRSKPQQMSFLK